MHLTRTINRLTVSILILFGIVALAAAYWAIIGPDTILKRTDNPRLVEAEARIIRGSIVDRNGIVLVDSIQNPDRSTTRRYLYPEMNSAIGYASLRYGLSGAEAAYNIALRGDDLPSGFNTTIGNILTHQPAHGSDIRLTFDRVLQREVVKAMGAHQGAVVVLSVPGGEVLAMVSLPTFDPNKLDTNWETLTGAAGKPFFNRAIQGAYQPGGILQTFLLAGGILSNYGLDESTNDAAQSVKVGDVSLECLTQPPAPNLTLQEAYIFGCPYPFARLAETLGAATVQSIFDTFRINQPPTLPGYVLDAQQLTTTTVPIERISDDNLIEDALGQGAITVSPMQMAVMVASILNEGNAPVPHTLLAMRQPDSEIWTSDQTTHPLMPLTTVEVTRNLQALMRDMVSQGAASRAAHANIDIGGHVALAYSGEGTQSWFVGFATLGNGEGIAVAVVIENSADFNEAALIGGQALAVAHDRLQPPNRPPTGGV